MGSPEDQAFGLLSEYANGFMVSQVLFAACDLGVFDLLAQAPEPLGAAAVAARLGTSGHGTELLLDACASLRLLAVETQAGQAAYANTALSAAYLVSASPTSQLDMLRYLGRTTYLCWAHLAEAVRQGRNQYGQAFGVPSGDLFAAVYRSEGERLRFMRALQDVWRVHGRRLMATFDLSTFPVICDLGGEYLPVARASRCQAPPRRPALSVPGCSGALARECLSLYPGCQVTVFDLPEVVLAAKTHFSPPEGGPIGFLAGDFFKDPLPEADLYILARVLHDWTDQACSQLLARVHQACRAGGGVLVVESLLDSDGRGPLPTQLYSLNMLVQTEGRERTPAQYHALLAAAGFRDIQDGGTRGLYDAILARK
ncbi:acetylserotonin O-methyltransferase isoform X1 [Talpa occidentalis]|uniref:acetylserotonin O-methyltransferase isoform X1 n=1 Tax=Talpa occidentalis TaxID=50954 RepID=UPI00188DCA6F|nr:acetylserotonin O-methyltransferase isoform X1 [Talpa occidentalis]